MLYTCKITRISEIVVLDIKFVTTTTDKFRTIDKIQKADEKDADEKQNLETLHKLSNRSVPTDEAISSIYGHILVVRHRMLRHV